MKIFIILGISLFILNIFYFFLHGIMLKYYKVYQIKNDKILPYISIIIPVFNEGKHIKITLDSLKNINYPDEKYEIIVINDGSVDDTKYYIQEAIKENNKIKLIDLQINKGKRHALYRGYLESNGEYLITLDSDSIVERDTIKEIIKPFLTDQKIGAVAGNLLINNNKFIPKLLSSAFVFGFEFIRSAQSINGIVMCTPGALSAYRKSALTNDQILNWTKQMFLFKRAIIRRRQSIN